MWPIRVARSTQASLVLGSKPFQRCCPSAGGRNNSPSFRRGVRFLSSSENDGEANSSGAVFDRSLYTEEVNVLMPAMGLTGGQKIIQWYKQEGDVVQRNDVICDIETPDFTYGMETEDEDPVIMGKIIVPAPSELVKDGEVICTTWHHAKKSTQKDDPGAATTDS